MFTPPPSPSPPRIALDNPESSEDIHFPSPEPLKKRTGRLFRLATVFLPLFSIIFTTYLLHGGQIGHLPALGWIVDHGHEHQLYPRHPNPQQLHVSPSLSLVTPSSTSSAEPSSSSSQIPVSDQLVPAVPGSAPILPTPFPQALDSGVAQNFSTSSCSSFFANMTSASSFRTCRPFSLLLATSGEFIDAQANLTLLNSIIWGTCNTPTPYDQCKTNMAWFAGSLQTNCAQELKEKNVMVSNTLIGLQTFEILSNAGCLSDPNSHTYCYLTAALSSNPFDVYIYSLPLGISVPKSSTTTCSACLKSIMSIYADALRTGVSGTSALKTTFYDALARCQSGCGTDFSLVGAGLNPEASGATRVGYMRVKNVLLLLGAWAVVFWFV